MPSKGYETSVCHRRFELASGTRNGKPTSQGCFDHNEQVKPSRALDARARLNTDACARRNGKPTSLGCFDHEEQAARAYDKMMLWCELHNTSGVKGGITNFDPTEYEKDLHQLSSVTQARTRPLSSLYARSQ